jgi:carboxylesterase type B
MSEQETDGARLAEVKGARTIAEFRAQSWQDVILPLLAPAGGGRGPATPRFGIVVDGYALPATVSQIFAEGRQNDVPTLTGSNGDEGGAVPHPTTTADGFRTQARQRFGARADAFLQLYPADTDEQARAAQNESSRDLSRTSTYLWALQRAATARTKAYTYFFTHPLPGPDIEQFGAFHTSEVPYVLNTLSRSDRPFVAEDRKIADMLSSYWANFAATGDPNGKGLPAWPEVTRQSATTMEVGRAFRPIPVAGSPAKLELLKQSLQPPPGGSGR